MFKIKPVSWSLYAALGLDFVEIKVIRHPVFALVPDREKPLVVVKRLVGTNNTTVGQQMNELLRFFNLLAATNTTIFSLNVRHSLVLNIL